MNRDAIIANVIDIALPLFIPGSQGNLNLVAAATAVSQGKMFARDFRVATLKLPGFATARLDEWANEDRCDEFCKLVFGLSCGLRDWISTADPDVHEAFPARELINVTGSDDDFVAAQNRWRAAGGRMVAEKMIALRDDEIWMKMSLLGFPFPPFSPTCGLALSDVSFEEAVALGLIDQSYREKPKPSFPFDPTAFKHRLSAWIKTRTEST